MRTTIAFKKPKLNANSNRKLPPVGAAADEVGEMMLEIYRNVAAEPMPPELIQFCLDNMPVGNFDDSVMTPPHHD